MRRGFTMIDFLVSIAVFVGLLGLISVNLLSSQQKTNLTTTLTSLMTDLRLQQFKAMTGDTEGRGVNDSYGIFFGTNSYTVFHGTVYNAGDTANFTVSLPTGIQLTNVTFPATTVIFNKGSGEVVDWMSGANSFALTSPTDGKTKTVTINRYGVVDNVN